MGVRIRTGGVVDAGDVLRLWRAADAAESTTDDEAALRGLLGRDRPLYRSRRRRRAGRDADRRLGRFVRML